MWQPQCLLNCSCYNQEDRYSNFYSFQWLSRNTPRGWTEFVADVGSTLWINVKILCYYLENMLLGLAWVATSNFDFRVVCGRFLPVFNHLYAHSLSPNHACPACNAQIAQSVIYTSLCCCLSSAASWWHGNQPLAETSLQTWMLKTWWNPLSDMR